MTTATAPPIQISFPKITDNSKALAIPPTLDTAANTALAVAAEKPTTVKSLACVSLLQGETLERARTEAAKLFPDMLENTNLFMAYGTAEMKGVNDLNARVLDEIAGHAPKEVVDAVKNMSVQMLRLRRKWDPTDPDNMKFYTQLAGDTGFITKLWRRGRTAFDLLVLDIQDVNTQINKLSEDLDERKKGVLRSIAYYDEMYELNEQEIGKLIYAIAVMELIRDLAADAAKNVKVGDASLGDRGGEEQARYAEFAQSMGQKIGEYKGRLFIAWSLSPRVRTSRSVTVQLAENVNEMICVAIPTMRNALVDWITLAESNEASQAAEIVKQTMNEFLVAGAAAQAQILPVIAERVSTPSLKPESVSAMANYFVQCVDGMITAYQHGEEQERALEAAISEALPIMADARKKLADDQVQRVISKATEQPLEIATSVPSEGDK